MRGKDEQQLDVFSYVSPEQRVAQDHPLRPLRVMNFERPGGSAIDARTTQHAGYAISQRKRKRVEECFGWL